MLLSEPPPTQGDLHFRVAGIPVRVHPFFWLVTLVMGLSGRGDTPPAALVAWIVVVFVSILVHELGHALLQRKFGGRPWITLHGIGGLASCDDCDRRPSSQILISLAGPAAGFFLAAIVFAAIKLSGHHAGWTSSEVVPAGVDGVILFGVAVYFEPFASFAANEFVRNMLWVNIAWGLINLLPVYPLDGGRIAREVLTLRHPRRGIVWSYQLSAVVAGGMAL
ncbi:MAG TPA: site-2 protease family protein, partial [Lacipirellula sp.]